MFSCYSAINLPVEFCVAFSGGTGNNKEQTLQSTEEDYFPSFLLLIGMPLEGQCCLKDFAVIIKSPSVSRFPTQPALVPGVNLPQ